MTPESPAPAAVRPDPAALDRILHAYRESQVLITSVRLGLFGALDPAGAPVPTEDLAAAIGLTAETCAVLCDGLEGLGLLVLRDGGYVAGPLAAAHLAPGAPYPLGEWVGSEQEKYVGFAGLADALRADALRADALRADALRADALGVSSQSADAVPEDPVRERRRREGLPPEQLQGLGEVARARAPETVAALTTLVPDASRRPGRILDAGGGHGMDAIGVLAELPGWTAVVADRAGSLPVVRVNAQRYGVADRVAAAAVDLETDDLGANFDVAFLFLVLGGKPEPEALAVLLRVHAALAAGGWVLVRGHWIDQVRAATSALKHMLRPGGRRTLTPERLLELLAEAGFVDGHTVRGDGITPNVLVAARRPK